MSDRFEPVKLVQDALTIAKEAHEGQFRWDNKTPYIEHPMAVAKAIEFNPRLLASAVGDVTLPYVAVAAALLHDVIEDTELTPEDLRDRGIPNLVIETVMLLTKHEGEPYLDYLLRVMGKPGTKSKAHWLAKLIKREDIKHNLSDSARGKKRQSRTARDKYQLALHLLDRDVG